MPEVSVRYLNEVLVIDASEIDAFLPVRITPCNDSPDVMIGTVVDDVSGGLADEVSDLFVAAEREGFKPSPGMNALLRVNGLESCALFVPVVINRFESATVQNERRPTSINAGGEVVQANINGEAVISVEVEVLNFAQIDVLNLEGSAVSDGDNAYFLDTLIRKLRGHGYSDSVLVVSGEKCSAHGETQYSVNDGASAVFDRNTQ